MPATAAEEVREGNHVALLAAVVIAVGGLLITVSHAGRADSSIELMDTLLLFNTESVKAIRWVNVNALPMIPTYRIFQFLFWVGVFVLPVGLLGMVGAKTRHKSMVCAYVLLAGALAVVMMTFAVMLMNRRSTVEPLVRREVYDLCNATRYVKFSVELSCPWAKEYDPSEVPSCGPLCKYRASVLGNLSGCEVMQGLCGEFFYEELAEVKKCTEAMIGIGGSMMYGGMVSMSDADCRRNCDRDIRCVAYAHRGAFAAMPQRCLLGAAVAATHQAPAWQSMKPKEAAEFLLQGGEVKCHRRTNPVALHRYNLAGMRLGVATLVLCLVLLASAIGSYCQLYNIHFKRETTPTAWDLGVMMLCPCFAGEIHRRLRDPIFSDDESGGDLSSDGESRG